MAGCGDGCLNASLQGPDCEILRRWKGLGGDGTAVGVGTAHKHEASADVRWYGEAVILLIISVEYYFY